MEKAKDRLFRISKVITLCSALSEYGKKLQNKANLTFINEKNLKFLKLDQFFEYLKI